MRYDLILVAFFFASCTSGRHQYYVSANGNDDGPGTLSSPFKTLQKVNSLSLQPGDAVYFKGGETFHGKLSATLNGTFNDSITISSYGRGRAIIDGGDGQAVSLGGKYFAFRNIDVKGSGRKKGNTAVGIQLIEASHALVENVRTEGFRQSGIGLWNCSNMLLSKIIAENNGFCGIYVEGTEKKKSNHIIIRDCSANNNPGDPTNLTNHSGNGILVGLSTNVLIDRCTATANGWDMPRQGNGPVGIWAYESDSVTIQYCISYKNRTQAGAKDGGGFDLDGGVTNSIIQYCLSYENEGAGYGLFQYHGASPWSNNILRYSVSINDALKTEGSGGIFIWSNDPDSMGLSKCCIYNNLICNMNKAAVEFEPQSINNGFLFFNNIFIGNGNLVNGPTSGEKFQGNVWWSPEGKATFRNYKSLTSWAAATGQETMDGKIIGVETDPLLAGPMQMSITDPYRLEELKAFQLLPSSPLKNVGTNVAAQSTPEELKKDFYGKRVPSGPRPEPGVYEIAE